MHKRLMAFASLGVLVAPQSLHAAETSTFIYDALGRLIATGSVGDSGPGWTMTIDYDRAGNRQTFVSANGGAPSDTCSFAVNDANGVAGRGPIEFPIIKVAGGSCAHAAIINYSTEDGTAIAGQHYAPISGSVLIRPNETSQAGAVVRTFAGSYDREFKVNIRSANGVGTIQRAQATGVIYDD
jgi:hypothetical protein